MSGPNLPKLLGLLPPGASLYHGTRGWIVRYPRYRWFGKDREGASYKGSYRRGPMEALQDFRRWLGSR